MQSGSSFLTRKKHYVGKQLGHLHVASGPAVLGVASAAARGVTVVYPPSSDGPDRIGRPSAPKLWPVRRGEAARPPRWRRSPYRQALCLGDLEARVGIEPTHKGFADLSLTAWVPRHLVSF
jgi:hypothetical protein